MGKRIRSVALCMLASIMLVMCLENTSLAKWDVKHSGVDYKLEMNNAQDIFLYNKTSMGSKVGTEYYLTYTVEKANVKEYRQQGIIGTTEPKNYPYVSDDKGGGGIYNYETENKLLIVGNTYFLKFTVTEDGYKYRVAWASGGDSAYIKFLKQAGEVKTNLGYFGVFFADSGMDVTLSRIRFYDKQGNDLGAAVAGKPETISIGREEPYAKDTKVPHTYTVSIQDGQCVAISNRIVPMTDTLYMEYKVKSSAGTHIWQTGVILSNTPQNKYPYLDGQMLYNAYEYDPEKVGAGPLFVEGGEYLLKFDKLDDKYEVTVQCTLNGKTTYTSFAAKAGNYNKNAGFYSLWAGDGAKFPVNLELEDFKCYDANKNNLGVQCNSTNCVITHYGELEDYAGCEAIYFNDADNSLYALYKDKTTKYTVNDKTENGTYSVKDNVMTVQLAEREETYDYMYQYFKDEEGETYRRLHEYKLTFEVGKGTPIDGQIINAENGYRALRPVEPTLEGNTFEGWYTAEGEEYNFDSIVSESITLYAKWSDTEYTASEISTPMTPYILVAVGTVCILMAVAIGIMIVKGKKNEHKKEKETHQ